MKSHISIQYLVTAVLFLNQAPCFSEYSSQAIFSAVHWCTSVSLPGPSHATLLITYTHGLSLIFILSFYVPSLILHLFLDPFIPHPPTFKKWLQARHNGDAPSWLDLIQLNTDLIRVSYEEVIVEHDSLGIPQTPQQSRLNFLCDQAIGWDEGGAVQSELPESMYCLWIVVSYNEESEKFVLTTDLGMELWMETHH